MSMNMNQSQGKPRVYWRKNQVYLRFPTPVSLSASTVISDANQTAQGGIAHLNSTVLKDTQFQLALLGEQGTSHMVTGQQATNNESLLNGVYLFPLPTLPGQINLEMAEIVGTFQIQSSQMSGTMSEMPAMKPNDETDHTLEVINLINRANENNHQSTIAIPNMLWSASDDQTHGCPICPPMPLEESAGQWHITVPAVPDGLKNTSGEKVTVFVLDTLPPQKQITEAATSAGNNLLLQGLARNAQFNYDLLSDDEAANPQQLVTTGKDITGELVGFPMPDHGIFIAGIIHDLAPAAKIECIRVLNNYGVGELNTLIAALKNIQFRMLRINPITKEAGDLYQQPVVINLSLLVMPPDNDIPQHFTRKIQKDTRAELHRLLADLMNNGAVIVASVGNDSDPRDTMMNPQGVRYGPRYPANFAYDPDYPLADIIPVGAVNGQGQPASYSNAPGLLGVATYGGELPTLVAAGDTPDIKVAMPPDALCGVYTSPVYPALFKEMQSPLMSPQGYPEYPAPNSYAWAYWSGTSFATPIISALAARVLESQRGLTGKAVREAITVGAPQISWTRLKELQSGPMIQAVQQAQQVPQPQQAQPA